MSTSKETFLLLLLSLENQTRRSCSQTSVCSLVQFWLGGTPEIEFTRFPTG